MSTERRKPPDGRRIAAIQSRFGRTMFALFLGAAVVTLILMMFDQWLDRSREEDLYRKSLMLENAVRSEFLARTLSNGSERLLRLGQRPDLDPVADEVVHQEVLQRLSRGYSLLFDAGMALLGPEGMSRWSDPSGFLPVDSELSGADWTWFTGLVKDEHAIVRPLPRSSEQSGAIMIAAPIFRRGRCVGVLAGAIDLEQNLSVSASHRPYPRGSFIVVDREGRVLHQGEPDVPRSPEYWKRLLSDVKRRPLTLDTSFDGVERVVAISGIDGTDLYLASVVDAEDLFADVESGFGFRMALGMVLAVVPIGIVVFILIRIWTGFRRSGEKVVREEQAQALGDAASLIAHEVRNSLNSIRLGLDLMLSGRRENAVDSTRSIESVRDEIERLSTFTNELLTFSRDTEPKRVKMDLIHFLGGAIKVLKPAAQDASVDLDLRFPIGKRVWIRADPTLLNVIIRNLVNNALETLSSSNRANRRVEVEVRSSGAMAEVRIQDNGSGISNDMKVRLFQPFVTDKPSGVGLGLALSRKIARRHGGDLVLERSTPGAVFLLTLPQVV